MVDDQLFDVMKPGSTLHSMLLVIPWSIKQAEESVIRVGLFKTKKIR